MVLSLVRDAIHIKMKARMESPLISVYEFCYAAGLGLHGLEASQETIEALHSLASFAEFKSQVQKLAEESDRWETVPFGERLRSLLHGCRIEGELNADAWTLFGMGLSGE
ncbi:MAG: DUF3837 family protein [Eubacteriales bacterium]|nr:DUF3837 family protein [Eubacteriales bacterium]